MRIAVIDLGTNTFNLLIADVRADDFEIVHNYKEGVALGLGGINEKRITPEAEIRAHHTFKRFKEICAEYAVNEMLGIATSAVRDAENGLDFTQKLTITFGIPIEIIDGLTEAELIHAGVSWSYNFEKPSLIMDIGGGSTEFIRGFQQQPIQACSLNIGVSRATQLFELSDPLSANDQSVLLEWFDAKAEELNAFSPCKVLVGASGSFETFYEMVHAVPFPSYLEVIKLTRTELDTTIEWILASTLEEREAHPFIIPIRRKMAPIAALKTKWILEKFAIQEIIISPCSLKEGVLRRFVSLK